MRKCVGFIFTELVACSDISETLLKTPLLQIKKIYISLTGYDVILWCLWQRISYELSWTISREETSRYLMLIEFVLLWKEYWWMGCQSVWCPLITFNHITGCFNRCPFNLLRKSVLVKRKKEKVYLILHSIFIPPLLEGGILFYLRPSFLPSVQDIFRRIFLSNCWWQKSDIWSQASYGYPISWEAFLDPSDSYFLFVGFVDF